MTDKLTVRDVINGGTTKFDPLALDTSEIKALSDAIPKDGNIDVNNAEVLAVKYLRGADLCAELLAVATAHVARTKSAKDRAFSRAFVKYKDDKSVKTDKMRNVMAELDDDYAEATDEYNGALAFAKWVDAKYNSFNKMHYMCKKILDRGYDHEKASGFKGNTDKMIEDEGW